MMKADAIQGKAWPFVEAEKILKRIQDNVPEKGHVLFETGYGPSGLPHIGTFGEVVRTIMVKHAFESLCDIPTKLIVFSDDMDGLRSVPDNIPNQEMVAEHLGKPLTSIPDPFDTHESFGTHMNGRLKAFLDSFGFEYEFKSATESYTSGLFDETLLKMLEKYDDVMKVMLPTLGEERQATYSPFLPICPESGKVLYVPVEERNVEAGTITYKDEQGNLKETPITQGHCKLQWKPDLGMRWAALDVDFEMYGKDHLASGPLYSAICEILGGKQPEQFCYELFLDKDGKKISKSKGNGLSVEEWMRYAPQESLAYYMFQSPRKAKRLHFDVIPKAVDEYLTFLKKFPEQTNEEQVDNPTWHVHSGNPPSPEVNISFALLINLASACNPEDPSVLWGFISRYQEDASPSNCPVFDALVERALLYYEDFVKPLKQYRAPEAHEVTALTMLKEKLANLPAGATAEEIQNTVFEVGRENAFEPMKEWFKTLYETLLGQSQGPRFGSFIHLYGIEETQKLIDKALAGELGKS